jgi:hypothetical protein
MGLEMNGKTVKQCVIARLIAGCFLCPVSVASLPTMIAATQPEADSSAACSSVTTCNQVGTQALRKGENLKALQCFKLQTSYAEDAHNKTQSTLAYNNLAVAYMHSGDYIRARSWVRLAVRIDPDNARTKYNSRIIEERLQEQKWPATLAGTYVQYAGLGQWSSLRVNEIENHQLHIRLYVMRMGTASRRYGPASYGDIECDVGPITRNQTVCKGDEDFPTCRIELRFQDNLVTLSQEGDCGFGHGVKAQEDYERINAEPTTQTNNDSDLP